MKKTASKLFLIISGAFIFNVLFWKEKLGLNAVLFDSFICISAVILFPYSLKNNISKWLFAGHIISAAMVLIQNTLLSKISFTITLLLFVSFSQYLHRSVWYAAGSSIQNYVWAVPNFFREFKMGNTKAGGSVRSSKSFRILLIPILILVVFAIIYSSANSVFSNIITDVANAINIGYGISLIGFLLKGLDFFYWESLLSAGSFLGIAAPFFLI